MPAADQAFLARCIAKWPDKLSRLRDGFYTIRDKEGSVVSFRMNANQEKFFSDRHGFDLILKARQLGFTTIIQLDMLDDALFCPNTSCGVVAHNRQDAEVFFDEKIRFAYDSLPAEFRNIVGAEEDTARSLKFSNGSVIRVGTSLRGGTYQRLHVSEYGKLCASMPDKAREVKAGAFNTVQAGQRITVESTADGHAGHFFELCQAAQAKAQLGKPLTALEFRFHFAPWWTTPEYALDDWVTETSEMAEYFAGLEALGIVLTRQQRGWYILKAEQQGEDMRREYPSTPEEAFAASVEGAYLARQMTKMRLEKRICRVPVLDMPVETSWDLGINDSTSICFWQRVGLEHRLIDYHEASGEGWGYYAKVLAEKRYNYRLHYGPHDIEARMMGLRAETRRAKAEEAGILPWEVVARIPDEMAGIDASRSFLSQVWIDEARCGRLIQCLDSFRKDWDDKLGCWRSHYRHDEYSHGYKALETMAVANPVDRVEVTRMKARSPDWNRQFA